MTHVSLFSGIDGFSIAAEWAGFRTIAQVESDPYCLQVLAKHWPDVYRCADIREFPPIWDGEHPLGPVTIITGGFPCQPVSQAGKRRGKNDDRWLWPEMLRVIREIAPRWVVAENVPGLMSIESGVVFESVLADMESAGYEVLPMVCPAAGVGAPHLRQRVFIVGHADGLRGLQQAQGEWETRERAGDTGEDVAHAESKCGERPECGRDRSGRPEASAGDGGDAPDAGGERLEERHGSGSRETCAAPFIGDWWESEPRVGRVATGVPHRVDRLRALGNSVNPYQVAPILQAIAEVERA